MVVVTTYKGETLKGPIHAQAKREAQEISRNSLSPCPVPVEPGCRRKEQDSVEKEYDIAPGCGYYRRRHNEFLERFPDRKPPKYYLEYGEKYCNRFTRETYAKLSDKGKKWFDEVKCGLQQGIENMLGDEKTQYVELMDADFSEEAFGMHAGVYLKCGLEDLDFFHDQWHIGWTPKEEFLPWKENFSHTRDQVYEVLPHLILKWEKRRQEAIEQSIPDEEWMYFLP